MIVTVTPNPSLDRASALDGPLETGEVQRATGDRPDAGGTGINVTLPAAAGGAQAQPPDFPRGQVVPLVRSQHDTTQTYALYLPSTYDPGRSWPVVFVMDPRGRARLAIDLLVPSAERHGYVVLSSYDTRSDVATSPNEKALVEGEHSPGLFLVLAGELVVQKEDPAGGVVSLGILREGDVAGEISLLTGLRATATVVATRKTATAFLDRKDFNELTVAFPNTKTYLESLSDRRLKQIGEALRPVEIIDADELVMEPDAPKAEVR
jgi:CRP-like cAMP-binding protein